MSKADCKDRHIGLVQLADFFDDLNVFLRISRAVGQHDAIRAGCEDFFCSCITGINGDFAATLCQGTGDVALCSKIEKRYFFDRLLKCIGRRKDILFFAGGFLNHSGHGVRMHAGNRVGQIIILSGGDHAVHGPLTAEYSR